jgi:peptide/nickel transport system substrate-binding protein
MRVAGKIAIVCGLVSVLTGCEVPRRRTPDDTLVVLIDSAMTTVDPRYTSTNYDTKFSRLIAPGLVAMDTDDGIPRLELAEDIHQVDELTWEATVRADARFSDDTPVTAGDVAWTFSDLLREGSDGAYSKSFRERFTSVEAVDDRHVRFHLVGPLATFMTDIDFGILPEHAVGADGHFPGGKVIGAGPYRLVSFSTERIRLEANPYYHGVAPRTPKVDVRVVRDQSARMIMLVGGSADLAQNVARLDLVDDIARQWRVSLESGPSAILTYIMLNNDDPVLKDVRVRQAIALAVDREAIIKAKFGGRAVLATGLVPPQHWAYEPDVPRWPYDPARARKLLDEAGYPEPPGGGPRLHFIYKTSADQFRVALARVLASQLADIGIELEVRPFEFNTFFADIKKGEYQFATMQTTDISEPDYYRTYFNSGRIPSAKEPNAQNRWRYRNARVDELTEQGRRVVDLAERKRIYGEIQKIVAEEVPIIALWHEDTVVLTNRDVTGYRILPNARFNGLVTAEKAP